TERVAVCVDLSKNPRSGLQRLQDLVFVVAADRVDCSAVGAGYAAREEQLKSDTMIEPRLPSSYAKLHPVLLVCRPYSFQANGRARDEACDPEQVPSRRPREPPFDHVVEGEVEDEEGPVPEQDLLNGPFETDQITHARSSRKAASVMHFVPCSRAVTAFPEAEAGSAVTRYESPLPTDFFT